MQTPTIESYVVPSGHGVFGELASSHFQVRTMSSVGEIIALEKTVRVHHVPGLGQLSRPIMLKVTEEDEEGARLFVVSNEELRITETGFTEHAAFTEFYRFLAADYRNLMGAEISSLAPDALDLRKRYDSLIAR